MLPCANLAKGWGSDGAYRLVAAENYAHRTAVRAALANDEEWVGRYLRHMLPWVVKQVRLPAVRCLAHFAAHTSDRWWCSPML